MSAPTVAEVLEAVERYHLLEPAQLAELLAQPAATRAEPRLLARALLDRGWLTAYQANRLLQGQGHELLLGSYVLLERLGEGGMGAVFKARNWKLGTLVALKLIKKERLGNPDVVSRFRREILAAGQLDHPNIVRALDAEEIGDTLCLVMEYVEGTDLARLVKQRGPLSLATACEHVRQAALGLQHAHEKGLVHRDVKPSNLLLTADGRTVKVLDFGLVRWSDPEAAGVTLQTMLTGETTVLGTGDYLAPEQAEESRAVDIRADLYSLGCTLYFLLSGKVPFPGGSFVQKAMRHQRQEPVALERLRPDLPAEVVALVRRLMAKSPEDRFQAPAELATALAAIQEHLAASPPRVVEAPRLTDPFADIFPSQTAVAPPSSDAAVAWKRWAPTMAIVVLLLAVGGLVLFLSLGPTAGNTGPSGDARASGKETRKEQTPDDVADAALRPLLERLDAPAAEREPLRTDLLRFLWEHPGTPSLTRAGEALRQLPSPWDQLDSAKIPLLEREHAGGGDPEKAPPGLVAVFGESRFKHWGWLQSVAFSPDGKQVAWSEATTNRVFLWDATTGRLLRLLGGQGHIVYSMAFSPDGKRLACAASQKIVEVWDLTTAQQPLTLKGHEELVGRVAFSPDGKRLATGSKDRKVKIWDATTGKELLSLTGHDGDILSLVFHPDGKRLASAGQDSAVKIWDLATGEELVTLPNWGADLAFPGDGKILYSLHKVDAKLRLWDMNAGKEVPEAKVAPDPIHCAAFRSDGKVMACAYPSPWTVKTFEIATGKELSTLAGVSAVNTLTFSADGQRLAGAGYQGHLWDLSTGRDLVPSRGHLQPIVRVAFSPDGQWLASGSSDATVRLWTPAGESVRSFSTQRSWGVSSIAFSPDGKRLALGSTDKTLSVWDVADGKEVLSLPGPTDGVTTVAFSPDGQRLASGGPDRIIRLWSLTEPAAQKPRALSGHGAAVNTVAFAPDGRTLASGSVAPEASVRLWDLENGGQPRIGATQADNLWFVRYSPTGKVLAAAWHHGRVSLLKAGNGTEQVPLKGFGSNAYPRGAFSPDGRVVAFSGGEKVLLFDTATGEQLREWTFPCPVHDVAFAPDGRHIATANANHTVYVIRLGPPAVIRQKWQPPAHSPFDDLKKEKVPESELRDAGNGDVMKAPPELVAVLGDSRLRHWSYVVGVAWSRDGKRLASGGDHLIKIWDVATGRLLRSLSGHESDVYGLAFHPEGKWLASASADQTVRIWDMEKGKEIQSLEKHGSAVRALVVSEDGKLLVSGGFDMKVRAWRTEDWKLCWTGSGHTSIIRGLAISPDGTQIASASFDKTVRVWDAASGRQLHELKDHGSEVFSVGFSSDGKRLASGDALGTIRLWDAATGKQVGQPIGGLKGNIECLALSRDGQYLATTQGEVGVTLHQPTDGKLFRVLPVTSVTSLAFSPDSTRLATTDHPGAVRVWDCKTGEEVSLSTAHPGRITAVALHPGGAQVASVAQDRTVRLWDLATGKPRLNLPSSSYFDANACFTPDGRLVTLGENRLGVRVRGADTGRVELAFPVGNRLAISADGQRLAAAIGPGVMGVHDVATGRELQQVKHPGFCARLALSPDGKKLAVTTNTDSLFVWDAPGKRQLWQGDQAHSVAFSPDGKLLAVGGGHNDHAVRLLDAEAGRQAARFTFEGFGMVTDVAFHPDGSQLAAAQAMGKVVLLQTATANRLKEWTFLGHIGGVAFAPDGRHLVTGNGNGTLYVLRLGEPPR